MNEGGTDIPKTDQNPIAVLRLKIDGFEKNPEKTNFQNFSFNNFNRLVNQNLRIMTFYEIVNLDFDSREK